MDALQADARLLQADVASFGQALKHPVDSMLPLIVPLATILINALKKKDRTEIAVVVIPGVGSLALQASRNDNSSLLPLVALDRVHHELLGAIGVEPVHDRHPLALFQILVVLEEMRDLLAHDRRAGRDSCCTPV